MKLSCFYTGPRPGPVPGPVRAMVGPRAGPAKAKVIRVMPARTRDSMRWTVDDRLTYTRC